MAEHNDNEGICQEEDGNHYHPDYKDVIYKTRLGTDHRFGTKVKLGLPKKLRLLIRGGFNYVVTMLSHFVGKYAVLQLG